jgi:hypothetical protein
MKIEEASQAAGDIPAWALEEARRIAGEGTAIQTLAEMIAKYEQPPVDDDVLLLRAVFPAYFNAPFDNFKDGSMDHYADFQRAIAAYRAKKAELETKR